LIRHDGRVAMVGAVNAGSPADKAGLRCGAYIHNINGIDTNGMSYENIIQIIEDFESLNITASRVEDTFGFSGESTGPSPRGSDTLVPESCVPRLRLDSCSGFSIIDDDDDAGSTTTTTAGAVANSEAEYGMRLSRAGSVYAGFGAVERVGRRRRPKANGDDAAMAVSVEEDGAAQDVNARDEELPGFENSVGSGVAAAAAAADNVRGCLRIAVKGDRGNKCLHHVRFNVNGFIETPGVLVEGRPILQSRVRTPPPDAQGGEDLAIFVLATFMNQAKITVNQYARIVMMLEEVADDPLISDVRQRLATPGAPPEALFELVKVLVSATEALAEIV